MSIDLANIKNVFKVEAAARALKSANESTEPTIAAVVVQKTADLAAVKKALVENGLKAEATEQADGSVIFKQVEDCEEGGTIVKMSDDLLLVVKGFSPWNTQLQSFNERLGVEGYYSGLEMGTRALSSTFKSAIDSAESPEEAMAAVSGVLADFSDYASGLVEALPKQAFTKNFTSVMKSAEPVVAAPAPLVEVKVDVPVVKAAEVPAVESKVEEKADAASVEVVKAEVQKTAETMVPVPAVTTATPVPAEGAPSATDPMAAIAALIQKSADATAKSIAELKISTDASVAALREELKVSTQKSAELEKKVSGTIAAPPPEEEVRQTVKKEDDEDALLGILDTARNPGLRRHK